MKTLNQIDLIIQSANEEAKTLQREAGLPQKGIESTQVLGLAIAWGKMLNKLMDYAEKKAEGKV